MVMIKHLPSLVRESRIVRKNAINELDVQVMSTTIKAMKITSVLPTQGARKIYRGVHKVQNGLHAIITVIIKPHFMVRLYFYP